MTARDIQQGCRWLKGPGAAEAALEELVKAGAGDWEPTPAGQRGQPTRRFQLSSVYGNGQDRGVFAETVDVDDAHGVPIVGFGSSAENRI